MDLARLLTWTADRYPDRIAVGGPAPRELDALIRRSADEPDGEITPPDGVADSDSVLLYTSGTTGRPKGVPRSHRAEHAAAIAHMIQAQHRPGEVTLGAMPLFHTMGMRTLLASIIGAGTWVPQPRFDQEESLGLITACRVSALYLVPTVYWSLLRTGRLAEAAGTVSRIAYAGAPMTPSLAAELDATLRPEVFVNHLGSTEIYTSRSRPTFAPSLAPPAVPGCSPGSASSIPKSRPGRCPGAPRASSRSR